jgi:uncharacterized membrane protein YgcG
MPNIQNFIGHVCGTSYVKTGEYDQAMLDEKRGASIQRGNLREQVERQALRTEAQTVLYKAANQAAASAPQNATPRLFVLLNAVFSTAAFNTANTVQNFLRNLFQQASVPVAPQNQRPSERMIAQMAAMLRQGNNEEENDQKIEDRRQFDAEVFGDSDLFTRYKTNAAGGTGMGGGSSGGGGK